MVVVGVLVDVLDVDDVLAAAGAPVEIDLTSEKEIRMINREISGDFDVLSFVFQAKYQICQNCG